MNSTTSPRPLYAHGRTGNRSLEGDIHLDVRSVLCCFQKEMCAFFCEPDEQCDCCCDKSETMHNPFESSKLLKLSRSSKRKRDCRTCIAVSRCHDAMHRITNIQIKTVPA